MKILRIIARLNVGGPARHVVWLTSELQSDEFQSVLVAGSVPEGESDMSYFAADHGVKPVYVEQMSRELSPKDIFALWKIYQIIRREKPDVIHTHTAKAGTVGRQAAFLYRWLTPRTLIGRPRRVKVVHTFHGHVFHSYYGKLKTGIFLFIEKTLARMATDRIIVISNQQRQEINERFKIGKTGQFKVIPLGIDLAAFAGRDERRSILRDEIAAAGDEIVVGILGRLTEIKNISLLLDAAELYLKSNNRESVRFRFVVVGDGNLRLALEHEAERRGLNEIVEFLGNRPNVGDLIAGMDIVALTSLNEGTPLSLIESMATGVPVVATAVGGVVDLAGAEVKKVDNFRVCERGITVNSGDADALLKALIYLAKDSDLQMELSRKGQEFVTRQYSKARLVDDIKNLYRELVKTP